MTNWINNSHKKIIILLSIFAIILVGIAGFSNVLYATSWGPWAFSDSAAYISYARSFYSSNGLTLPYSDGHSSPLQEFPPFYPIILGLINHFSGDYLQAARWLDAISFALLICLIGLLLLFILKSSWVGVVGALFIFSSPVLIKNFTGVMTEPIFILLAYGGLFLVFFFVNGHQKLLLLIGSFLLALATLTRYVGIVFVLVAIILLIIQNQKTFKQRFREVGCCLTIALTPLIIWLISVFFISHTVGTRTIPSGIDYGGKFTEFINLSIATFKNWLPYYYRNNSIPDSVKGIIFLTGFCIWLGLMIISFNKAWQKNEPKIMNQYIFFFSSLLIASFALFLTITYVFTQPAFVFSERIWSPVIPALALVIISSVWFIVDWLTHSNRWVQIGCIVILLFLTRFYFLQSNTVINEYHQQGYGYTAREIQESGVIPVLEHLPINSYVISNNSGLVDLYFHRMPAEVLYFPPYTFGSRDGPQEYEFRQKDALLIILFDELQASYGQSFQTRLDAFTKGLQVVFTSPVGNIYKYPS